MWRLSTGKVDECTVVLCVSGWLFLCLARSIRKGWWDTDGEHIDRRRGCLRQPAVKRVQAGGRALWPVRAPDTRAGAEGHRGHLRRRRGKAEAEGHHGLGVMRSRWSSMREYMLYIPLACFVALCRLSSENSSQCLCSPNCFSCKAWMKASPEYLLTGLAVHRIVWVYSTQTRSVCNGTSSCWTVNSLSAIPLTKP